MTTGCKLPSTTRESISAEMPSNGESCFRIGRLDLDPMRSQLEQRQKSSETLLKVSSEQTKLWFFLATRPSECLFYPKAPSVSLRVSWWWRRDLRARSSTTAAMTLSAPDPKDKAQRQENQL